MTTVIPTTTADGKVKYDTVFRGETIAEWVNKLHKYNCGENGWKFQPLLPGAFGFDNLAHSIDMVSLIPKKDLDIIAEAIHIGWMVNYVFWRDNKPYEWGKGYRKPASPLGDARRDACSVTLYSELPEEEKAKDKLLAKLFL